MSDVNKSAKILENYVDNEVNLLNGDYSKIIVGGHSQGACISLYQAYTNILRIKIMEVFLLLVEFYLPVV